MALLPVCECEDPACIEWCDEEPAPGEALCEYCAEDIHC